MHDLVIATVIAVELAILGRQRRFTRAPALFLFNLYVVAAQVMAWLVMHDIASHEMLELYGGPDRTGDLFIAIVCAAVLFLMTRVMTTWGVSQAVSMTAAMTSPPTMAIACATAWTALFLAAAATLDWARLWTTSNYLDLTDPEVMTRGALPGMALGALPFAGAASAGMAAALYAAPHFQRLLAGLLTLQAALTTAWLLAAHSRAAALAPAAFAFITLATAGGRNANWRLAPGGLMVIIALAGALAGRNGNAHGLASLLSLPAQIAQAEEWLPRLAGNLTEGIFAVATGLGEWRAAATGSISFPGRYIWLSFSPLPSAVDGFADILDAQVRLHAFAPMPGYVELAWFGVGSQIVFIVLIASACRLGAEAARASAFSAAIAHLLLTACLYLMAAYPVRTALKPLWLSLGISITVMAAARWRVSARLASGRSAHDAARPAP